MQYTSQRHLPEEVLETLLRQIVRSIQSKSEWQLENESRTRALQYTVRKQLTDAMLETQASAENPPITIKNIDTYFDLSDMEREMVEMARYLDKLQGKISMMTEALTIIEVLRCNWCLSLKLASLLEKTLPEIDKTYNYVRMFQPTISRIQRRVVLSILNAHQKRKQLEKIPSKFLQEAAAFLDEFDKLSTALRLFIAEAAKDESTRVFAERFRDF